MTLTRRFVVLLALMFWQGGFMFYGAITVPVTRAQLPERKERSLITQRVTQWMNLIGTVALLAMFADVWASPLKAKRGRKLAWIGMALPHLVLFGMHIEMSRQMAVRDFHNSDMHAFSLWHRTYLMINTIQWLAGMVFAVQSLQAWRAEDRSVSR